MQVRVRLLDMGVVRPWRSQAIYHGLAAALTPETDPAIILVRTSLPYLSIALDDPAVLAGSLAYCLKHDIPVIVRQVPGPPELIDQHQLGFQLVIHQDHLADMGLAGGAAERSARLAGPLLAAYNKLGFPATFHEPSEIRIAGKRTGSLGWGQIEAGLALTGSMVISAENDVCAHLLTGDSGNLQAKVAESLEAYTTTLQQEKTPPPRVENLAARLVDALEQQWNLDVYPAFPTLDELEVIEEYDHLLRVDPESAGYAAPAGTLESIHIRSDVQVLRAAGSGPGAIEVVIRTVADQIDSLLLSGNLQAASKSELAGLAEKFTGAGLDADELLARFNLLMDADNLPQNVTDPAVALTASPT